MQIYTTWLPLVMTLVILAIYVALPVKPTLVGEKGLASSLLTIISTLPGFYFAGLAAVATFGNTTMDYEMPAPAPEVGMVVSGNEIIVKLTRRLFFSYLFSYLVIISLILCFALIGVNALAPSLYILKSALVIWTDSVWPWIIVKGIAGFILVFIFSSMIISTLHGVFFLTEKIHQP